ncbi:MAG: carboxylesterase family protein [Ferruginibacter sp.]|nr:carboxylesterase family protein [Ferruginibacter sp.]
MLGRPRYKNQLVYLFTAFCLCMHVCLFAQDTLLQKKTIVFATPDTTTLKMDIYGLNNDTAKKPCILFMFGGGFIAGNRDSKNYSEYFKLLVSHHFIVVSIDYRLGLKGKKLGVFNTKPLQTAIGLAVTDLYSATNYLLANAAMYGIDTSIIILSGSSSGAITVMSAEWEKCNATKTASALPAGFNYAGVISFAGAIFSTSGKPSYKTPPSPIMMFHGTKDKLVYYNKRSFLWKGIFGSASLAGVFEKKKYPYYFQRVVGKGHEIAETPMITNQQDIIWFIEEYIFKKKRYLVDVRFNDLDAKQTFTQSAKDIYEK